MNAHSLTVAGRLAIGRGKGLVSVMRSLFTMRVVHRPLSVFSAFALFAGAFVVAPTSVILSPIAASAAANEVLMLGSTLTGGAGSLEAQRVIADGFTPVIVDNPTWTSMTTAQFASYRAIVIGDPTCGNYNDTSHLTAALSNPATWGAAVNGNVLIIGTDPVFHSYLPGPGKLITHGIDFALAQAGKVGAYLDLSCAYGRVAPNTPLTLLDGIRPGGFTVDGGPSTVCYNDAHIVATHPALTGLTDADLSNWSCSVHEAFDTWPADYTVLAMARNYGSTYTASDGTIGTPYILASGAGLHSYPLWLTPAGQSVPLGTSATVTASLLDITTGNPAPGVAISFRVQSGPNAGTAGSCVPSTCLTDSNGNVGWTYTGVRLGTDTVQAWLDTNHNGVPDPGEAQTTAGVTWIRPLKCPDAGQMVSQFSVVYPQRSSGYDRWQVDYGISKCEGLVIDGATFGRRLMAERMSVPYLNVLTCNEQTVVCNTSDTTNYHVELKPSADESFNGAYLFVELLSGPSTRTVASPNSAPCYGSAACEHLSIAAVYRVWLTPPTLPDSQRTYLDVTQNYEFYHDFDESKDPTLSCEPAAVTQPISVGHLSSCGRWKPLVSYQFHPGNVTTLDILSFNAVQRLHFTPDAMATRAVAATRDCDSNYQTGCAFAGNHIEAFAPGNQTKAIGNDLVFLAVNKGNVIYPQDGLGNPDNLAGRYDNLHVTPAHEATIPDPLPPGCFECVHMHWRWGKDIPFLSTQYPQFGGGAPLIGNCPAPMMVCGPGTANPGVESEPAAVANPYSRQLMFVAVTPYHSEQLAPYNFMDAVKGATLADVGSSGTSKNPYPGYPGCAGSSNPSCSGWPFEGFSKGSETLSYEPQTCFSQTNLSSWGQCGQVVWLSAQTYGVIPHDEDADTLFAFGGFFCSTCTHPDYQSYLGLAPKVSPGTVNAGGPFSVGIDNLRQSSAFDIYDILPAGATNISVQFPQGTGMSCSTAANNSGGYTVHCAVPALFEFPPCPGPNPANPNPCVTSLTITANAPTAAGTYRNVTHVVWAGGNFRPVTPLVVVVR